jgi:hypothetical protein
VTPDAIIRTKGKKIGRNLKKMKSVERIPDPALPSPVGQPNDKQRHRQQTKPIDFAADGMIAMIAK